MLEPLPKVDSKQRVPSQLSLRSLFFLQAEAAAIMLFITLAWTYKSIPVPVIVATFIGISIFCCLIGTTVGLHFSKPWWNLSGPLVGLLVGLIASALTLSSASNFYRLLWDSILTSTVLVALSCWLGRSLPQEESIAE
jgi:hypothetical protein